MDSKIAYTLVITNVQEDKHLFTTLMNSDSVPRTESKLEKEILKTLNACLKMYIPNIGYTGYYIKVIIPDLYRKSFIYYIKDGKAIKKKYKYNNSNNNKKYKVIFLDKDGVLNGYNYSLIVFHKLIRLFIKPISFELFKKLKHKYDIFGLHKSKIKRLKKIIKYTGAKIVITSSIRNTSHSYNELVDELNRYNIEVFDKTPKAKDRTVEIFNWLSAHESEVENYVVIDDERMNIFRPHHIVQTSHIKDGDIIKGRTWERTGLQFIHMIKAIKLLNRKDEFIV